jgi:hypothetical protein
MNTFYENYIKLFSFLYSQINTALYTLSKDIPCRFISNQGDAKEIKDDDIKICYNRISLLPCNGVFWSFGGEQERTFPRSNG